MIMKMRAQTCRWQTCLHSNRFRVLRIGGGVVQSIFMALDWNESFLFLAVGCQKVPELLFRLLKQRDFLCVSAPFFDYTLAQLGVLNRTICGWFPGNLEGGKKSQPFYFSMGNDWQVFSLVFSFNNPGGLGQYRKREKRGFSFGQNFLFYQGSRIRSLFHLLDSFRSFIHSQLSTFEWTSIAFVQIYYFWGYLTWKTRFDGCLFCYPSAINIPFLLCTSFERFLEKPKILSNSENLKSKKRNRFQPFFSSF